MKSFADLAAAIADVARTEWDPPVTILWSPIQTASLVSTALCGPFHFEQSLIKKAQNDPAELERQLKECAEATVSKSAISSEQAPFTDISGGVALAVYQRASERDKYLVVISDFLEDLPEGQESVTSELHGEHVVLLHRQGRNRLPSPIADHLNRVEEWSEHLKQVGAASVVAMPLKTTTRPRLVRALNGEHTVRKAGTNVVVLQDLPPAARPEALATIAASITRAARELPSPVTVTWADMRNAPEPPWQMPPLEFSPSLIKRSDSQSIEDFSGLLSETAAAMARFIPGAATGDVLAALQLYISAGVLDEKQIFFVLSSFPAPPDEGTAGLDLFGTSVVMLAVPTPADASNQAGYLHRVDQWQKWFRAQRAQVCRISLNGITESSLLDCVHGH